ncbi:S24/S26 family peptidase [Bacteroides sp. 224]|uniref:S24/S26 family peptidase n=1 Tax=Bacteroides sp. 224 TaxID=2302936 RepID=UPI0013D413E1|nr:S24/S26 family peptidase [Bacteroides sp. 224]NDV66998.1 hypothetical protein [Bacteroides sp. 224]
MKTVSISNEALLQETARLIAEGRTVTHLVRGNSMAPFLVDRRDKVILSSFNIKDLKPGVVVLARDTDHRIVLHRIIRCREGKLILMGDGNIKGTETTAPERVMGVATQFIRKGKSYSVSGYTWRIYSVVWKILLPLRRFLLGAWRRLS